MIQELLMIEHSKANTNRVVDYLGVDEDLFSELMEITMGTNTKLAQRAAWVVREVFRLHPFLVLPYVKQMIAKLSSDNCHDALYRNFLAIMSESEIEDSQAEGLLNLCFSLFTDKTNAIAIRVHSMQIIFNLSENFQEIRDELKVMIEDEIPFVSGGFVSRGKRILIQMKK